MFKEKIKKIDKNLWEIPASGKMNVPARIYANETLLENIFIDDAINQVVNVATLPGIVNYSLAMPDIHSGYGFPIGGVAATDVESGVISPGGVGYDINCGVRFIRTDLTYNDIKKNIREIIHSIQKLVPSGVGASGAVKKLSVNELKKIMVEGISWAILNGYGNHEDLAFVEEKGKMLGANPEVVSRSAINRGLDQIGTLGSGNHFIELGKVVEIFDKYSADIFGISNDQIIIMIHSGSRGLGHQICTDYVNMMHKNYQLKDYELPDKKLICAPINSTLGKDYYGAMAAGANYAWANRQIMMSLVEKAITKTLSIGKSSLNYQLVYDVSHNIAKFETHNVNGTLKNLCVHRKGATRAFPPMNNDLPDKYKKTGQPVIIPGDMGRESYLCTGTENAMKKTFGSSCHGAGRVLSRTKALKKFKLEDIVKEYDKKNIIITADNKKTLIEEYSQVYKDVSQVVNTLSESDIIKKVCKTVPLGVVKG